MPVHIQWLPAAGNGTSLTLQYMLVPRAGGTGKLLLDVAPGNVLVGAPKLRSRLSSSLALTAIRIAVHVHSVVYASSLHNAVSTDQVRYQQHVHWYPAHPTTHVLHPTDRPAVCDQQVTLATIAIHQLTNGVHLQRASTGVCSGEDDSRVQGAGTICQLQPLGNKCSSVQP
jgi:hypothetical protein